MRFDVFGREVAVARSDAGWEVFYQGEGKRRPAHDIMIPPDITEAGIGQYLEDLCHEWATDRNPRVRRLDTHA